MWILGGPGTSPTACGGGVEIPSSLLSVGCGEFSLIWSHLLEEQHQSQRLKETEPADEEGWLCSGDCSGADGADGEKEDTSSTKNIMENPEHPLHNTEIQ